jgi:hypothetical protein
MKRAPRLLAAAAAVVVVAGGWLATAVDAPPPPPSAAAPDDAVTARMHAAVATTGTGWSAIPPRPAAAEPERKPSPIKPGLPAYVAPLATQRPFVETPTSTPAPVVAPEARGAIPAPAKRSP